MVSASRMMKGDYTTLDILFEIQFEGAFLVFASHDDKIRTSRLRELVWVIFRFEFIIQIFHKLFFELRELLVLKPLLVFYQLSDLLALELMRFLRY